MTLPTAVATGAAADTSSAVRPARVGIVAGVVAAVVLFSVYLVAPVPERITSLLGAETTELARQGGMRLTLKGPDGLVNVVDVPGVLESDADQVVHELTGPPLTFRRVVRAAEMPRLVQALGLQFGEGMPTGEIDTWRPEGSGETRTDYHLVGRSRAELEALLARGQAGGWSLPPDLEIAYEYIEPWEDKPALWRTYVVSKTIELDGSAIQEVMKTYDPNTERPIILLDFTPEATTTFGDLTEKIQGEKLATMRGDLVMSAPIINGPIRGGRASITMGGNDPAQQQREARVLAGTLSAKRLSEGATLDVATYVPPTSASSIAWVARGVIAVFGGLFIGLAAWAVVRRTRPVRRSLAATAPGGIPWSRVAVTLLAPLVVFVIGLVPAAGISMLGIPKSTGLDPDNFNIGLLGTMPVFTAYVLVEVLAMLIPSWRRRRHAGDVARRPLAQLVPAVAIVLAVLQAWMWVQYFGQLSDAGVYEPLMLGDEGLAPVPFIASVLGGVAVLVILAAVIRRWGLGNGYGALMAADWLHRLVWLQIDGEYYPDSVQLLYVVAPLAIVLVGIAVARWRVVSVGELALRIPSSGVAPVAQAGGILAIITIIAGLPIGDAGPWMQQKVSWLLDRHSLLFALVLVMVVGWSAAFARGRRLDRIATRTGLTGPSSATWRAATALTAAVLFVLAALALVVAAPNATLSLDVIAGLVTAAVLVDIVHDFRGRRVPRVRVWALHQPHLADVVERALGEADIPCHLTGANLRAMLSFFGPYAPIDVYVRPEDATRAHAKLVELLPVE